MPTSFEVEQKYPLRDTAAIERKLRELGVNSFESIEQADTYLAHPSRDFSRTDEAFRLRRVGERNYVTYKGPKIDATTKTRREIELPLPNGKAYAEEFIGLQEALGFRRVAEVLKLRKKSLVQWQDKEFEIAIDDVAGVGHYVELEIVAAESEVDEAKAHLASLAKNLGLSGAERRSYLELLLERES